jgi:hypothetical protein
LGIEVQYAHRGTRTEGLTVRLLVTCAGGGTAELLGLAAARVGDHQGAVVAEQDVLDLLLGGLIDV